VAKAGSPCLRGPSRLAAYREVPVAQETHPRCHGRGRVLVAATALPAGAAGTGSTTAVIELVGGTLDISVPAGPVALASGAVTDTPVSGQLGTVTVTDTRAADPASWTASVSATPFRNGSHSLGAETYNTGVVTSTGSRSASSPSPAR
jgi:hypothetical protein